VLRRLAWEDDVHHSHPDGETMATSNPPLVATIVGFSGVGLFLSGCLNNEPFTSDPVQLFGILLVIGSWLYARVVQKF
jgi:hypothetical protein